MVQGMAPKRLNASGMVFFGARRVQVEGLARLVCFCSLPLRVPLPLLLPSPTPPAGLLRFDVGRVLQQLTSLILASFDDHECAADNIVTHFASRSQQQASHFCGDCQEPSFCIPAYYWYEFNKVQKGRY